MNSSKRIKTVRKVEMKEKGIETSSILGVEAKTNFTMNNSKEAPARSGLEIKQKSRAEKVQRSYQLLASDEDDSLLTRRMAQKFQNAAIHSSFTME
jgi:hypothetical protein